MLSFLRQLLINRTVRQQDRKLPKTFLDWPKVETIALLVTRDEFFQLPTLQKFAAETGKRVEIIIFCPGKEVVDNQGIFGFSGRELNLLGLPKSAFLAGLKSRSYDLLIDANFKSYLAMQVLSGFLPAKFKVGLQASAYRNYFDICIEMNKQENVNNYLEHVLAYLKMIKTGR
jgi:hypothetical protein